MTNNLIVVKPFYTLDAGDTFSLNDNGDYVAEYSESMGNSIDDGADIYGSFTSQLTISKSYADELIEQGYLRREKEAKDTSSTFVNVFTEIDSLLDSYKKELANVDKTCADMPQCVKVEKTTVLNNLVTVLSHLKNLKK